MQSYEETLSQSVALWRTPGNGLELAIRFVGDQRDAAEGELCGRLMCLHGQYVLMAGRKNEAYTSQVEALELVTTAAPRTEVLVSAINVCIPFRRVAQGLRYAGEVESLLTGSTDDDVVKWRAVYLRNTGELLMVAGDYESAIPHLRSAVEAFELQGKRQESLRSQIDLADALMHAKEYAEALAICRSVRLDTTPMSTRVTFRLNVVQSRIAARIGKVEQAERLIDRAYAILGDSLSDMDKRALGDLEVAKSEAAEAKGDVPGARTLRYFARRICAAVGVASD